VCTCKYQHSSSRWGTMLELEEIASQKGQKRLQPIRLNLWCLRTAFECHFGARHAGFNCCYVDFIQGKRCHTTGAGPLSSVSVFAGLRCFTAVLVCVHQLVENFKNSSHCIQCSNVYILTLNTTKQCLSIRLTGFCWSIPSKSMGYQAVRLCSATVTNSCWLQASAAVIQHYKHICTGMTKLCV